jgi:hypothetical protein
MYSPLIRDANLSECIPLVFITISFLKTLILSINEAISFKSSSKKFPPEIHEGMKHSYCMTERLKPERTRFIQKEETFNVGDFTITCFEVPHDGTDNVGYCITTGDKTFSFLTEIQTFR